MKKIIMRTRTRTPLALAIGTFALLSSGASLVSSGGTLVGCASVPNEGVESRQAALHAAANDTSARIYPILDAQHGDYDLFISNHTVYRLTFTNQTTVQPDHTVVQNLELGGGASPCWVNPQLQPKNLPTPTDIGDPAVQSLISQDGIPLGYGDLIALDCHSVQDELIEFDFPLDGGTDSGANGDGGAGTDHRLFLRLPGDKDPATGLPTARNVGCGGLLLGMGINPLNPSVVPLTLLDPNNPDFVVSDAYDINCYAGQPPSSYKPALFANPATPETVSRGQTASVEFTTSENDLVPTSAVLVPTGTNDCVDPATGTTFLTIGQPTTDPSGRFGWPVAGVVPGDFTNQGCSASYYLTYTVGGTPIQTSPATFTLNTGCREGTLTDCSGCGDTCKAPANAAPVCKTTTPNAPGVCTFTCNSGWANCDGADCSAQMGSLANCGGCANACPTSVPGGRSVCTTAAPASWGKCDVACNADFSNCDGDPNNGCESNPQTDPNNCGACGNKCGGACVGGVCACVPVTPSCSHTDCGFKSDGCGGGIDCGEWCAPGLTCVNNACVCIPEQPDCSTSCGGKYSNGCGGTYTCPTVTGAACCRKNGTTWIPTPPPGHCSVPQ